MPISTDLAPFQNKTNRANTTYASAIDINAVSKVYYEKIAHH